MGAIGGLLGLAGGIGGAGHTDSGTNPGQIHGANLGVEGGLKTQNDLLAALQGQQGLQNQSNVYGQLQGVVSGQGPNPAQAQLAQATGANVANQAALMAGQRGAGSNVGLMARQAAQQGGALQQQAAGQGATMQAQQSLNALGQAGGMANTMAGQQIGQVNANTAAQQAHQNALLGANTAAQGQQAGMAGNAIGGAGKLVGGLLGGAGGIGGLLGGSAEPSDSEIDAGNFAGGGMIPAQSQGPQSLFGRSLMAPQQQPAMSSGGMVPAVVSPGERYLKPEEAEAVYNGQADPMQVGEKIPGQAKVKGDSYKNDTVPKKLEVGGIVLPRSIENSKKPGHEAKKFVDAYMAKKKVKRS